MQINGTLHGNARTYLNRKRRKADRARWPSAAIRSMRSWQETASRKPIGDLLHAALPARHTARRERPGDQRAQPRVVRRVDVQHGGQPGIVEPAILGAEAFVVPLHGVRVLVAVSTQGSISLKRWTGSLSLSRR